MLRCASRHSTLAFTTPSSRFTVVTGGSSFASFFNVVACVFLLVPESSVSYSGYKAIRGIAQLKPNTPTQGINTLDQGTQQAPHNCIIAVSMG